MDKPSWMSEELWKSWSYEFETWMFHNGFEPTELIASADVSPSYEMDRASLFKNQNGSYSLVYESGCSCYSCSDADIQTFPNIDSVMDHLKGLKFYDFCGDSRKELYLKLLEGRA